MSNAQYSNRRHVLAPLFFFVLTAVVVCCPAFAGAESARQLYIKARANVDVLRHKDPEVKDLRAWQQATVALREIVERHPGDESAASAAYHLGRMYERMYRNRGFRPALGKAVYFYEALSRDFRGHRLADDALLYLGDLRRHELKDEVAARAAYFEIVDTYPSGDMYKVARERLRLNGSDDSETVAEQEVKQPEKLPAVVGEEKRDDGILSFLSGIVDGDESSQPANKNKRPLIVIDPGHGGEDLGAVHPDGVLEKDVVLAISFFLERLLRERLRVRTSLTRVSDKAMELPDRTKFANEQEADLFISIHANATESHRAHGIETYYLDNTNDKGSLRLAEKENQHYQGQMSDLGFMLSDLIQNAKLSDSISLAHHLQDAMVGNARRYYRDVRDLGVKKGPFFVLVGAHMPCSLVEVGFLDHTVEGRRLADRRYQRIMAEAIYKGIRSYFEKTN